MDIGSGKMVITDGKDWPEAAICVVFLAVFPIATVMIWRAPAEIAPLYFKLPFTLLVALTVPFFVQRILSARTRRITINQSDGAIEIIERAPFRRARTLVSASDVARAVFESTDDDGCWYTAGIILSDGRSYAFAQGNIRTDVREKFDNLLAELRRLNPNVRSE